MTIRTKIERVIDQGAQVKADADPEQWTNFTLRMKVRMSKEIDDAVEEMVGLSKTGFVLQAIDEKLKRMREY